MNSPIRFPRMGYAEAMRRFGSDKPDLRNPLELVDVADLVAGCDFKVFAGPAKDPKGRVAALRVPGGGAMPRSQIDDYTAYVARYGAKGLAYIKVNETAKGKEGLQSPIVKFLSDESVKGILERTGAKDGDLIFFGADSAKVVSDAIGALRLKVGVDQKLTTEGWKPLWVVDFPMFDWDPDEKRWVAMHHPFTAPVNDDVAALKAKPDGALAKAYDLVLNGSEIAGGSVRIFRQDMQSAVFELVRHRRRRSAAQVRLPARCAQVRRAAARRHRVRPRPPGHAHGRHRQHPRRHRVPEDADGCRSAHRRADRDQREAAARSAHPRANAAPAPENWGHSSFPEIGVARRRPCDCYKKMKVPRRYSFTACGSRARSPLLLRRRIAASHGFACHSFTYRTVSNSVQPVIEQLAQFVSRIDADRVHFVGHSLGGIVLHRYFEQREGSAAGPRRVSRLAHGQEQDRRARRAPAGASLDDRPHGDG